MKNLLLWLCFFFNIAFCQAQSNIDVLHYKFEVELSDTTNAIIGKATIKLISLKDEDRFQLNFFNSPKGVDFIRVFENQQPIFVKRAEGTHVIEMEPEIPLKKNEERTFTINYKCTPADGLIISKNKYGHRTFFADNWPDRAHNWIPCVDDPADKATVEFIVTAPSHYQVISNGIQIEETNLPDNKKLTHWKEDVPLPTKVMVIGVADFAVNYTGDVNCIPISSWVFPENKKEGFSDYAQAKDILAFYSNYIGPYPYRKLASVQSKTIFGGMENASAIFYFENSVTGKQEEEALIAHETVHQWFGNMATEKSFAHLWLSEGFATYLTHIFIESKYGTDSLNKEMQADRETVIHFVKSSHKPVVDSVSPYKQLLNANSYQKGSWVLQMLRRQLGDSVFKRSIRKYYAAYAGKNAETKDFQKIVEDVSGKNLSAFFSQWLNCSVNPSLKITWKYLSKEKKIKVDIEQTQGETVFNIPLEIEIRFSAGKKITMPLNITSKLQSFIWPVKEKPLTIIADPNTSLLFEGRISELK